MHVDFVGRAELLSEIGVFDLKLKFLDKADWLDRRSTYRWHPLQSQMNGHSASSSTLAVGAVVTLFDGVTVDGS